MIHTVSNCPDKTAFRYSACRVFLSHIVGCEIKTAQTLSAQEVACVLVPYLLSHRRLFTTEGDPPSNKPNVLAHVAFYNTQSCRKETPCGKSPSFTCIGLQALLDRLHSVRGAVNDPDMCSVVNTTPPAILEPPPCQLATRCWRTIFFVFGDINETLREGLSRIFWLCVVLGKRCCHSGGTFH